MSETQDPGNLSDENSRSTSWEIAQPAVPREVKSIEATLSALRPREDRLDRERTIFLAGQASCEQALSLRSSPIRRWAWPVSFAAMTAAAAVLLTMLLVRAEPAVIERVVYLPAPAAESDRSAAPDAMDRLELPRPDSFSPAVASNRRSTPVAHSTATGRDYQMRPNSARPQFRLFEHLLVEESFLETGDSSSSESHEDAAEQPILSPRSVNQFLEDAMAAGPVVNRAPPNSLPGSRS